MAKFEKDAADFKADLERLGIRSLTLEEIAGRIGFFPSHVSNLLAGGKKYTPGARTKLGEMIAAGYKWDQAASDDFASPIRTSDPDMVPGWKGLVEPQKVGFTPTPEDQRTTSSGASIAEEYRVDLAVKKPVDPRIYKIFHDPDGRAVVTKVLARFTSTADADEYVLFLNSQIRHGSFIVHNEEAG